MCETYIFESEYAERWIELMSKRTFCVLPTLNPTERYIDHFIAHVFAIGHQLFSSMGFLCFFKCPLAPFSRNRGIRGHRLWDHGSQLIMFLAHMQS